MSDDDSFPDPEDIRGSWLEPPETTDSKLLLWIGIIVSASLLGSITAVHLAVGLSMLQVFAGSWVAGAVFTALVFKKLGQ